MIRCKSKHKMKKMEFRNELLFFRVYQVCGFAPFPFNSTKQIENRDKHKWRIYNGVLILIFSTFILCCVIFQKTFLGSNVKNMITYLMFIALMGIRSLTIIISTFIGCFKFLLHCYQ